ncbi:MAG: hypothetical protein QM764_08725 [Chitinophagaceae bacterium]
MGIKNFTQRFSLLVGFLFLLISTTVYAQRGRSHWHSRGYYHSYSYRPHVSVAFHSAFYRPYRNYYYRPHYSYFRPFIPHIGFRLMILPPGFHRIYVGPYSYYYNNGIYYSPLPQQGYEIVKPPLGARVNELPADAQPVVIDGQQYYVLDGTYYREETTRDNRVEYVVVGVDGVLNNNSGSTDPGYDNNNTDRVGDRVNKLPSGSRSITIRGKKYYESPDGTYYEEIISPNKVEYEVVGKPD